MIGESKFNADECGILGIFPFYIYIWPKDKQYIECLKRFFRWKNDERYTNQVDSQPIHFSTFLGSFNRTHAQERNYDECCSLYAIDIVVIIV